MTIEQMIRFLEKHYDIISLERGSKFNSKKPNMWEVRVSNRKKDDSLEFIGEWIEKELEDALQKAIDNYKLKQ